MEIAGSTVLITGAAGSIGSAIAHEFSRRGANLVLTDRDEERLSKLVLELSDSSDSAGSTKSNALVGDISEEAFHRRLIDAADAVGGLDISILNAGIYLPGLTWEVPAEQWARQIDVNFWGVAHGVRAALPGMIERGKGHIVAVASGAGLVSTPGLSAYVASKHAVVGMMESVRHELNRVKAGVGASVVCPGNVVSDMAVNSLRSEDADNSGLSDQSALLAAVVQAGVDAGTGPEVVALAIAEAVESNRFWVIPHQEIAWAAADRTRRIVDGEEPVDLLG
ncbi:MAG: SDR family NAD(P)-dependent oxidoreductase [Microthrixaceae bacterium]